MKGEKIMDREEAIEVIQKNWPYGRHRLSEALQTLIPELQESEDERIRKWIRKELESKYVIDNIVNNEYADKALAWLEKQGEPKVNMIQWKGDNLKEVVEFTGKSPKFGEWFKTWEEYENYVHSHGDIFKLFDDVGNHYEVPVGAWIVKTPDGYNTPSRFGFVPKFAEWSGEDEKMLNHIIKLLESLPNLHSWLNSLKERVQPKTT